jgi:hypothetical protein
MAFKPNAPNNRFNTYYYHDATAYNMYNDNFKQKNSGLLFYHKDDNGRITELEDTQIEGYIGYWP